MVDDFSRECLGLVADTSLSGVRVARELDAIIARRGKPKTIVSDNVLRQELWRGGRQQISFAGRALAASHRTNLQPGPPWTITRTDSVYDQGHQGGRVKSTLIWARR